MTIGQAATRAMACAAMCSASAMVSVRVVACKGSAIGQSVRK